MKKHDTCAESNSPLYQRYKGERLFLLGNGPSLEHTSLDSLVDEYSMALNGINLMYDETDWRPTFYCFFHQNLDNSHVSRGQIKENQELATTCFINENHREKLGQSQNTCYLSTRDIKNNNVCGTELNSIAREKVEDIDPQQLEKFWSDNPLKELYLYHSMYGAIQLAVYMGFDEIYLIGCDLSFEKYNPFLLFEDGLDPLDINQETKHRNVILGASVSEYVYHVLRSENVRKSIANGFLFALSQALPQAIKTRLAGFASHEPSNHFSPVYRTELRDKRYLNDEITRSHVVAKKVAGMYGVDMYNATVGGELETYPRKQIEEVV